ncbi:hypothetical protein GS425_05490 [Rhodococcus hoagii]|nr:hypothetical protein [Prescottella equi]
MTEQTPASGDELAAFYRYKATQAGVILEHDDEVLVEQAAATLDLIAALQRDLDEHGVMLVGATGTAKVNPASVEIRQQRTALAKLTTLVGHRIEVAASGVRPVATSQAARAAHTGSRPRSVREPPRTDVEGPDVAIRATAAAPRYTRALTFDDVPEHLRPSGFRYWLDRVPEHPDPDDVDHVQAAYGCDPVSRSPNSSRTTRRAGHP